MALQRNENIDAIISWLNDNISRRRLWSVLATFVFFAVFPGAWMYAFPVVFMYSSLRAYLREKYSAQVDDAKTLLHDLITGGWRNMLRAIWQAICSPRQTMTAVLLLPMRTVDFVFYSIVRGIRLAFQHLSRMYLSAVEMIAKHMRRDWQAFDFKKTIDDIANYLREDHWRTARFALTACVLYTFGLGPSGLLISYGMNRFNSDEWFQWFRHYARIFSDTFYRIKNAMQDHHWVAFSGVLVTLAVLVSLHMTLGGVLFHSMAAIFQVVGMMVGATALSRDLARFILNGFENARKAAELFLKHPGKFYGGLFFSHRVIRGIFHSQFLIGSMEALLGRAGSYWGIQAIDRFCCTLISLVTNSVLGYSIVADSSAYVISNGVTIPQIFFAMLVGAGIGYAVESLAHSMYDLAADDIKDFKDLSAQKGRNVGNLLYQYRWPLGFVTAMTPLLLASPWSLPVYQLAGGHAVAAAIISTGLSASLLAMYLVGILVLAMGRRIAIAARGGDTATPVSKTGTVPDASVPPTLSSSNVHLPAFSANRASSVSPKETVNRIPSSPKPKCATAY